MAFVDKLQNVPTVKAYNNLDFLTSPVARQIRIMCELQEPGIRLDACGVHNYFLFVGSSMVKHPDERSAEIAELETRVKSEGHEGAARLLRAQKCSKMDKYYVMAQELATKLAALSQERQSRGLASYQVATGGGPGIMEAANRGASSAGDLTLGFGASRQEWGGSLNPYVSKEVGFEFHYFFMRKFWMAYKCMGLVALPGGYGSLDEIFELLALLTTGKIKHRLPIILLGRDHWTKVLNLAYLEECGLLSAKDLAHVHILDSVDEVFAMLKQQVEELDLHADVDVEQAKRRRLHKTPSTAGE